MAGNEAVSRRQSYILAAVGVAILLAALPGLAAAGVAPHLFAFVAAVAVACERWLALMQGRAPIAAWLVLASAWTVVSVWATQATPFSLGALACTVALLTVASAGMRYLQWRRGGVSAAGSAPVALGFAALAAGLLLRIDSLIGVAAACQVELLGVGVDYLMASAAPRHPVGSTLVRPAN